MSNAPKTTPSGKLVLIVTVNVKPGKEGIATEALKVNQEHANSDEAPGIHTFRLTRRLDSNGSFLPAFVIFEEYASVAALKEQLTSPGFQRFVKTLKENDVVDGEMKVEYLDGINLNLNLSIMARNRTGEYEATPGKIYEIEE
ncbi:hypothetical protein BDP27DRAFT_1426966 [Rhodocollybia butyracea]|uniref:ABM domain-containing protein n=1 Tax=Rhodocollybia butyracea TaxID=206335 RepID=A0A9P5PHA5_9AGAR|nr:hypothetical protein BDP27DRAFT_1426966 [Rhodocollybia butyracea]